VQEHDGDLVDLEINPTDDMVKVPATAVLGKGQGVKIASAYDNKPIPLTMHLSWSEFESKSALQLSESEAEAQAHAQTQTQTQTHAHAHARIDLDASCIMLDGHGHVVDIVSPSKLKSKDGSVTHSGNHEHNEKVMFDLQRVHASVQTLGFVVNSVSGEHIPASSNRPSAF
jgi:stress response protein SCP2